MNGRRSRDKGTRTEHPARRLLRAQGQLTQGSRAWCPGSNFNVLTPSVNRGVQVKCRAAGFCHAYGRDYAVLIVKADRQEPLVVLRMFLATEIAGAATGSCTECDKGRAA